MRKPSTRPLYLLMSCDRWKSDLKLRCAATTLSRIKAAVIEAIHDDAMLYGENAEELNKIEQIKVFRRDWKTKSFEELNNLLMYGFLDITFDGENY